MTPSFRSASRRRFLRGSLAFAGLGLVAGCGMLAPSATPQRKLPRIGFLVAGTGSNTSPSDAFTEALRELGYVEGQNLAIERRYGEGRGEKLAEVAAELARLPVHVIVAVGAQVALATKKETAEVPIVLLRVPDPVSLGLVASLARPGGNITGVASVNAGLSQKRLELLKAAFPAVSRVAVLWTPSNPVHEPALRELETAARMLQVELRPLPIREQNDFEVAFQAALAEAADALMPLTGDFLLNSNAGRVVEFAATRRLPAIYPLGEFIDAGGLMAYISDEVEMYRRAATYVDKIFKGANPSELPVEQATKFDLVVNLKTAQALGLTIPQAVMQQATHIIQ